MAMDLEVIKAKLQNIFSFLARGKGGEEGEEPKGLAKLVAKISGKGKKQEEEEEGASANASGTHDTNTGVKRKLIGAAGATVIVFLASVYFFSSDDTDKPKQRPQTPAQSAQVPAATDLNKDDASYKDLAALNAKNQQAAQRQDMRQGQAGQNPNQANQRLDANGNAYTGSAPIRQQPSPSQSAQTVVQARPAPAASIPVPAAPRAAVSSGGSSSSGNGGEKSSEKSKKDDMEQRYASAIDFALGKSSGGEKTAAETAAMAATAATLPATPGGAGAPGALSLTGASANMLQVASLSPYSASPYVVQAGTLIPAILFSGINTDTPGQVVAQTSADTYDTLTGQNLLIPAGSRLIGTYEQGANAGTGRINVTFSTIIFPTGEAFDISGSILATDAGGYNGLAGKVHRHTMRTIGAGMISSAIAALGSIASGNTNTSDTYSGGQLAMQGAMANLIQSTANLFSKNSDNKPTITLEPGHSFQLFVARPISFGASL